MIENKKLDITLQHKGGGSFINLPAQFSNDGLNVFVSLKDSVLEYSTKTGKLIYEYKTREEIIGFSLTTSETQYILITCSKKGLVTTWKVITHFKLSEKRLSHHNIKTFHVINSENDNSKILYSYLSKGNAHFVLWNGKTQKTRNYNLTIKDTDPYFISVNNPDFFTVVNNNEVYFVKTHDHKSVFKHSIHPSRTFTCVCAHPVDSMVITGDSSGRVLGWQDIFSNKPIQTVFHWHTLPVQTVSFSSSGSYFYSGGSECVLVKWLFENPSEKQFVPRIAAELRHVTVSNNHLYIAVSTNDNAVRIFDNTLNQITLIQQLVLANHFDSGIVYDTRSRALIMNGNQGHIQFYSPNDLSLLYSIDIVGHNKITNERGTEMVNTEVTKVAISKSGVWFSTVEERKDKEYNNEIRLKFWKFDESNQQFQLNTSIEYPHEDSINSMLFQLQHKDENLVCVTVGDDKKFKIWQITETEVLSKIQLSWKCYGVGFYRNLDCKSLSFSVDGSLFGVTFKNILTVWTPDSCTLKCSLIHPFHNETLKQVHFGVGDQCHSIVVASDNQISVWNILTLNMVWTVPISVSFLISDSLSSNMAVITADKKIYVFSPGSCTPLYHNDSLLKQFKSIKACNFIPSRNSNDLRLKWYERTQLYVITSGNELYCLCESEYSPENVSEDFLEDKSLYEMITPQTKSDSIKSIQSTQHLHENEFGHKTLKTYLDSPLHTLVPIRYACSSLLKSFVLQDQT